MSDPGTNPNQEGGAAEVARPDWLPESHWNADAKTFNADALKTDFAELATLRESKTAAEARAASLPKEAKDYKVELPEGFKVPEGKKFQPDENDPMVAMAREFAKEKGFDQADFSNLVGRYAKMVLDGEAAQANADKEFLAGETKALGEQAEARRGAIKTWLTGNLTADQAAALEPLTDLKVGVEAMESIIAAVTGTVTRGTSEIESGTTLTPEQQRLRKMYPTMAGKAA